MGQSRPETITRCMGEEMTRYTVAGLGPMSLAEALIPDRENRSDTIDGLRADVDNLRGIVAQLGCLLVGLGCDAGDVANAIGIYGLEEYREPEPEPRKRTPTLRRKNVFKANPEGPQVGDMEKFAGVPMFISAVEKMESPGMYRVTLQSEKP
jgi:hypothetical protein